MDAEFRVPVSPCSYCGQRLDTARAPQGRSTRIRAGDISLCLSCGTLHRFTKTLTLVPLTDRDLTALHPTLAHDLQHAECALIVLGLLDWLRYLWAYNALSLTLPVTVPGR